MWWPLRYSNGLFLCALSTVLYLQSCTTVYFERPQPANAPNLYNFPATFTGSYLLDGDTIHIRPKEYIYPEIKEKAIPVDQLDSFPHILLNGDSLKDLTFSSSQWIPYTTADDTLLYQVRFIIHNPLSDSLHLRSLENWLVINERDDQSSRWNVYLVEQQKNQDLKVYAVGNFQPLEDQHTQRRYDGKISDFAHITSFTELDEQSYLIDPDPAQLNQLIKKGFFVPAMDLIRLPNQVSPWSD